MSGMSQERVDQVRKMGERLRNRPDWYGSEDAGFAGQLLVESAEEIRRLREVERQLTERSSGDGEE